jgi:hypothetical protein
MAHTAKVICSAVAGLAAAAVVIAHATRAQAAGAAYQVDTSEISEAGNCKIEAWFSRADNKDYFGAMSPACSVPFVRPLELSVQYSHSRQDEEPTTQLTPKAKVNLVESAIGKPGWAVSVTAQHDLVTNQNTALAATVPMTLRLSNVVRINVNAGWAWDRVIDQHYFTYGVGVDWRTSDNVWTLTAEVYGLAGPATDPPGVTRPRFQTGLRWRPIDRWNVDLIYGRNLYGEQANWVTLATILRFPAKEKE